MRPAPHNRHDAFFRRFLGDPAIAAAELRHMLPARVSKAIDWRTHKVANDSFIDRRLRETEYDVVFEVKLRGRTAAEMAGQAPPLQPCVQGRARACEVGQARLHCAGRALRRLSVSTTHHASSVAGMRPEPRVGGTPRCLRSTLSASTELRGPTRGGGRAPHRAPDAELLGRPAPELTRLALLALQNGRQPKGWRRRLAGWAPLQRALVARPDAAALFEQVRTYVMLAVRVLEPGELVEAASDAVGDDNEEVVKMGLSLGERLLREGAARGQFDHARASLRRVLSKRGLAPTPEQERRIDECADLGALDRWLDAAVVAATSAEALDGA